MNTHEFLAYFFTNCYGRFEITVIAPPEIDLKPHILTVNRATFNDFELDKLHAMNQRGYGVYYGLTTKRTAPTPGHRSKESNSMFMPLLWADLDGLDADSKPVMVECLTDHQQPPSVIVDSGGGLHALWKLTHPMLITQDNQTAIKEVLRGLAAAWKSDPSVAETARVFRLPGFINTKPKRNGAMCQVVHYSDITYTFSQFSHYRKLVKSAQPVKRNFRPIPRDLPYYVRDYVNMPHREGTRNDALNKVAWRMLTDGYSEAKAHEWLIPRAMADGLGEREILNTIASAYKATPGTPSYVSNRNKKRMAGSDSGL